MIYLPSPVEVEADESLVKANRKSGLLNSVPVLPSILAAACVCVPVFC